MRSKNKYILVVGDRVLIRPDKGEKKSKAGLYLPPSVIEKQEILSGVIVEVGPGIPLGSPEENIAWHAHAPASFQLFRRATDLHAQSLFWSRPERMHGMGGERPRQIPPKPDHQICSGPLLPSGG